MRKMTGIALCSVLVACSAGDDALLASADVTGTLLVANKRGDSLSRIDLATGEETGRTETCANPHELAVSPDGADVVVACYGGSSLEIYETDDLDLVATVELASGARPHGVVWNDNGSLVATAEGRGSIFTVAEPLSARPVVREIGGGDGGGPHMVVVSDDGTTAWGTIISSGTVVRYDLVNGTETARRALGGETEAITLSPDGQSLWVGANGLNRAYRLDPETLETLGEGATGDVPIRLVVAGQGDTVISSNFEGGTLSVIEAASGALMRTIIVSGAADAAQVTLVASDDGERLYVAETAYDTIAEVDLASGRVLRRLPTQAGGDGLAIID